MIEPDLNGIACRGCPPNLRCSDKASTFASARCHPTGDPAMFSTRRPGVIHPEKEQETSPRILDIIKRLKSLNAHDRKLLRLLEDHVRRVVEEAKTDLPVSDDNDPKLPLETLLRPLEHWQVERHSASGKPCISRSRPVNPSICSAASCRGVESIIPVEVASKSGGMTAIHGEVDTLIEPGSWMVRQRAEPPFRRIRSIEVIAQTRLRHRL
ncbi:hypothetical protein [Lichenifustis flavocetrariae]|uniref:Uncharacterized protein n=1 Tax=Lichenifustis flavocetrariae TaxID=2949735 RepID=A0AA41Z401_9HYPH|nr:hypothetical protein [Lichenifustis flavocetrariae]MCW6512652.1 hypothetical protein [Lichenifustis flavocetrariae]